MKTSPSEPSMALLVGRACIEDGLSAMETFEIMKFDVELCIAAEISGETAKLNEMRGSDARQWYRKLRWARLSKTIYDAENKMKALREKWKVSDEKA